MAIRLNQDEAMNRNFKAKNAENIDFSKFIFINTRTKSKYICRKHEFEFEMTPSNFWMGHGCSKCAIEKQINDRTGKSVKHKIRKSNYEIVSQFEKVHGKGKYIYDCVNYEKNNQKVEIKCHKHDAFWQTPNKHLLGRGCPKCADEKRNENNKWSLNDFIKASNKVHKNKYEYITKQYNGANSFVEILCDKHGLYRQKAIDHLNGHGCKKCAIELNKEKLFKTNEQIIERAKTIHGDYYDYSLVNYSGIYNKIDIICPSHGKFKQIANIHLRGGGCPKCNKSKGEKLISEILDKYKIIYVEQHKFSDCKNKALLPFDFYLNDLNICIEFQGVQHYNVMKHWGGELALRKVQINDSIKKNYCLTNKIKLIEIKFSLNNEEIEDLIRTEILDPFANNG